MVAEYSPAITIKIDGVPVARELKPYQEEVCIDDKAQMPSMFTITYVDAEREALRKSKAKIGSMIEIQATPIDKNEPYTLIKGEITALEGDYGVGGARAIIRGYDLSHRLHRGRHTETYVNTTDSDIAKKIARRHGIQPGQIDSTTVTYKHVSQAAQSDWDFISERARKLGFEVGVVDGKFNFGAPKKASEAPPPGTLRSDLPAQLKYGDEIIEFYPRITAGAQVKNIRVRGWDPETKKELVGSAPAKTESASLGALTPMSVASDIGSSQNFVSVQRFVADQSDANDLAKALAEHIGSAFAEADGVAIGDPRIIAGKPISIGSVSDEFKGKWVITHARHVINAQGYRIHFSASGRQERSLLGLTSMGLPNGNGAGGRERLNGLVVGIVTNNDDNQEKQRGRVKVRFPWLANKSGEETYESTWARVVSFGAGPNRGAYFIPEVDDEVLVGFEHGDINRPYVLGGLYNGQDPPNLGIQQKGSANDVIKNGEVTRRGFTSRKGHAIVFIDDDSASDGIVLRSSDGKFKIEIKEKGKELHITGDPKIIVTAQDELTLESKKNITIKADMGLKIEAGTTADLKAGSSLKVKGTTVDVKGDGPVSVSGATIKLN